MSATDTTVLDEAAADADEALARFDGLLADLDDGQLHLADPSGGWTVAQLVSHVNLASLLWVGNVQRAAVDPDVTFFFREEIGHDVVGYPPPTVDVARRQLASTRRTLATAIPATDPAVLDRTIEIPDLGTMTIREWYPPLMGHVAGHVDQAGQVLRNRGALPGAGD